MKRIVLGTIVGAIVLYVVGYLIFNMAAADFYAANQTGPAGAFRDALLQWADISMNVPFALLITLFIARRTGAPTITEGFVAGAVVGFLIWLTADMNYYAFANLWNLSVVIVDPLLEAAHAGIGGAAIAAVLAMIPTRDPGGA
jgi:hypothetical protein